MEKKIVSTLRNLEKRRITYREKINLWEKINLMCFERGYLKAGKEWEDVLAEIFEMRKFFGENSKIWLTDPKDDNEGQDLVIYINKEKDLLLAIDLTLSGDDNIVNGKFVYFFHDNPVDLKVPPKPRENNPKALKFVLALPKVAGLEAINRFFETLGKDGKLENLRNDQNFQKDPVILAILSEFLEQMNGQLDKFSEKRAAILYKREIDSLQKIISDQRKILERESTPETKQIENYLKESHIGRKTRKILREN